MAEPDDGLESKFRMPRSFGPAPGPRNLPADKRHLQYEKELVSYTISARTDPDELKRFLPDGLVLDGEARLEVSVMSFRKIGWLAGRGYDILLVRIPARWTENLEECAGYFVPVVWENMADPIITGREELGWAKIFADISVPEFTGQPLQVSASWDGHRFFELHLSNFETASSASAPPPMVFEKYVPATGKSAVPDAHYLTVTEPDGPKPHISSQELGRGQFAFHGASWEQMPTQYPIVQALAALPFRDFSPVTRMASSSGGVGSEQRQLKLREQPFHGGRPS